MILYSSIDSMRVVIESQTGPQGLSSGTFDLISVFSSLSVDNPDACLLAFLRTRTKESERDFHPKVTFETHSPY